jgi:hypothetical protein
MATHYHLFVLEAALLVAYLVRALGEPSAELEEIASSMGPYAEDVSLPNGDVLTQGDSDDGTLIPFLSKDHARVLGGAARALKVKGARLLDTPPPPNPKRASRRYESSNQVVLRSQNLVATFDAGPFGFGSLAAHAHCDALAVNVGTNGQRLLVDRGTYRYNGAPKDRDHFRSTAAHNTIQIGRDEQGVAGGAFLWTRQPTVTLERSELRSDGDIVVASHDGFQPQRHRRSLVRAENLLLIVDEIRPYTERPVIARYHFAPELQVTHSEREVIARTHEGQLVGFIRVLTSDQLRMQSTRHSDKYAALTDAVTLECAVASTVHACIVGSSPQDPYDHLSDLAHRAGLSTEVLALLRP